MLLTGEKTIESRFSYNKCAPYEKVCAGDELLIKQTGKDVTMIAEVEKVEYFNLTPALVDEIRVAYGKQIGTDKIEDWQTTMNKKYCTLVWVTNLKEVEPIKVQRSCGAGWIIL